MFLSKRKRILGNVVVVAVVRNHSREKREETRERCVVATLGTDRQLKWMTCRKPPLNLSTMICRRHAVVVGGVQGMLVNRDILVNQGMPGIIIVIGNRFRTIFHKKSGRKWMPPYRDGMNPCSGVVAASVMISGADRNEQSGRNNQGDKSVPRLTGNLRIERRAAS